MSTSPKKAMVIGATGLVGKELVQQLIQHPAFNSAIVFVRRTTGILDIKLREIIIDFNQPSTWRPLVTGDVLFSALGTTIKQAGSKQAQYLVDYTYQYEFAKAAADNHVDKFVLVSSAGASAASNIFYTRIKGELERDVSALSFRQIDILQPGFLEGNRQEYRFGEKIGLPAIRFINRLGLFKNYRPVHASVVARMMINAALQDHAGLKIWKPQELTAKP